MTARAERSGSGQEPARVLEIVARREEADDVVSLELRAADGVGALPGWTPGAHVDLVLGPGLVRQYSLCGDPDDAGVWRVAVLREPASRGGSRAVHERLHPGSTVPVRGPRNAFALVPAPAYLFVVGGIGITPVLPMAREAARRGVPWRLAYGGRTRRSMAFVDELRAIPGGQVDLVPMDLQGHLPVTDLLAWAADAAAEVYCCGPSGLIEAVVAEGDRQLGAGRVHVERFRAADGVAPGDSTGSRPFTLEVASHGVTLEVSADRTALEALEEAGVPVLSSCREGTCGTCEVTVVEGEVDHRDSLLTAEERAAHDTMFPCVSRAVGSRLVVEV